jgi:hypothetical protein
MSNPKKSGTSIHLKCILAVLSLFAILVIEIGVAFGKLPGMITFANWAGFIALLIPTLVFLLFLYDDHKRGTKMPGWAATVGCLFFISTAFSIGLLMKWPGGFWQIGQTTNVIGLVFWLLCSIAFTWAMWNEEEEEKS